MNPADGKFINPYTFVPFPEVADGRLDRREPAGHDGPRDGGWHGTIVCEMEAVTRLLLRAPTAAQDRFDVPVDSNGEPMVAGSSLHGALRSLHEIIAGGCLRVFDGEFLPSYRDQMVPWAEDSWRLVVVEEVDDVGRPTRLSLCERLEWIERVGSHRPRRAGGLWVDRDIIADPDLCTGDRIDLKIPAGQASGTSFRPEYGVGAVTGAKNPDGRWVVMFTDPEARPDGGKRYFITVGRIGDEVRDGISDAGWQEYVTAAAGSADLAEARQQARKAGRDDVGFGSTPGPVVLDVCFPRGGGVIGRRHAVFPWLNRGQVLWAKVPGDNGLVEALKPAWLWRHSGRLPAVGGPGDLPSTSGRASSGQASERVPATLLPCTDPTDLCPSCRVFGSADPYRRDSGPARQDGYRGHVRVLGATSRGATRQRLKLAPMGAPRPGAGQFYLVTDGAGGVDSEKPLREWGSALDHDTRRPMRGRKMYWRTSTPDTTAPQRGALRHLARSNHKPELCPTVEVLTPGSKFSVRLVFENLTEAEVGGLIAALDPGRLLRAAAAAGVDVSSTKSRFVVPLGGGKPFGFGSVRFNDITVHRSDPAARYRNPVDPVETLTGDGLGRLVQAFVSDRLDRTPWLGGQWMYLAHALRLGRVSDRMVWYPPGAPWSVFDAAQSATGERRERLEEKFDAPFTYFAETSGWLRRSPRSEVRHPLAHLPMIDVEDQRIDIHPDKPGDRR